MTELDLEPIKAREKAATPGPWHNDGYLWRGIPLGPKDTAFIAAARTDVPLLIREVERLRAEKEQLTRFIHSGSGP